jgi:hypothetical protein
MGVPFSRARKIFPMATWLVAMSNSNVPPRRGAPKASGFVPSASSPPPKGTTMGSAFVVVSATSPCLAARRT